MIPFNETIKVHELSCVGLFTVDRYSVRVDFQTQEVWDAVIEFVDSEFQILMEVVELM